MVGIPSSRDPKVLVARRGAFFFWLAETIAIRCGASRRAKFTSFLLSLRYRALQVLNRIRLSSLPDGSQLRHNGPAICNCLWWLFILLKLDPSIRIQYRSFYFYLIFFHPLFIESITRIFLTINESCWEFPTENVDRKITTR